MILNLSSDTGLSPSPNSIPEVRHMDVLVYNILGIFSLQEKSFSAKKGGEAHYIFFSVSSSDRSG